MARPALASAPGVAALIEALRVLPGVGPRSAQRMAYHLLQHDRDGAQRLAHALEGALSAVRRCSLCNNFTEAEICALCRSPGRDRSLLCVVETPSDLAMIEQADLGVIIPNPAHSGIPHCEGEATGSIIYGTKLVEIVGGSSESADFQIPAFPFVGRSQI